MNYLYTVGYSCFTVEEFFEALKKYEITALVDVRSQPFSKYKPEFNKDNLTLVLKNSGIKYVFLGKELGARTDAPECKINGKVSYYKLAEHKDFKDGLQRVRNGMEKFQIAIMCAEKDPITCHRTILISRNIKSENLLIKHILENGELEEHSDSEIRLLKLCKLEQEDLFKTYEDRLKEAYEVQGNKIAYAEEIESEEWN